MVILVTGGAGFIGSHLIRYLVKNYPDYNLINLDALTYAADLSRLDDINNAPNYQFVEGNINDSSVLGFCGKKYPVMCFGVGAVSY
ncbi:MAG: GDP-mannose 4,6-dehydratase [Flavobacteriaceae bacterium]